MLALLAGSCTPSAEDADSTGLRSNERDSKSDAQTHVCNAETLELIGTAYAIASAYPFDFPAFVEENSDWFAEDGKYLDCTNHVAAALMTAGFSSYDPDATREHAYNIASDAGAPQFGPQVADSINSLSADLVRLSTALTELSESVTFLLRGDSQHYEQSYLFTVTSLLWNTLDAASTGYDPLMTPQDVSILRQLMYDMTVWYLEMMFAPVLVG
ncbi:MAG: hypothetical protein IH945_05220 [Armatimonadetes bacterium]|nr:hypothetical protein [Armatimonadota bacterium]